MPATHPKHKIYGCPGEVSTIFISLIIYNSNRFKKLALQSKKFSFLFDQTLLASLISDF